VTERFGSQARGARIHPSAELGESVRLSPGVVVEADCRIASECVLDAGCVLHRGTRLGRGCHIGTGTAIGTPGFGLVACGTGFEALPHHAGVVLGEQVHLGPFCNVSAGLLDPTEIASACHLDAQVQVGHNCRIGQACRIAAQTGLSGSVQLGSDCLVGGQAGFADHVVLGSGCVVAARAGVTKNWPDGTRLGGFPARPLAQWRRDLVSRST
jgi:UDP-3-O-[3-hydroxymyristoyl] glucosamine N-acyltransferase